MQNISTKSLYKSLSKIGHEEEEEDGQSYDFFLIGCEILSP